MQNRIIPLWSKISLLLIIVLYKYSLWFVRIGRLQFIKCCLLSCSLSNKGNIEIISISDTSPEILKTTVL